MGSGPNVPDANDVSKAQTKSNVQTAVAQTGLNAMNQSTPFGNLTYKQVGKWPDGTPRFESTTTLSKPLQNLFNTGVATQQSVGNTAQSLAGQLPGQLQTIGQPSYQNYSGGPNLNSAGGGNGNIRSSLGTNDYGAQRQQVEDALMGRVNQSYDRDRVSLEQKLANQGIQVGSEAYRNSMDDFNRGLADARTSAVLGAGQEQNRLQQLDLNAGNFANQAEAQRYNQTLGNNTFANTAQQQMFQNRNTTTGLNNDLSSQRFQNQITGNNQNINQVLALLGGGQLNTSPQFQNTPQTGINGTDVAGNAWQSYNAQNQQNQSMWNGLGALGSTAASLLPFILSDKRAKTDIRDTGMRTPGGVPIKDWRYKGSPMMQRGYIAQDVVKAGQRDAVKKTPGGFLAVNYRRVA